MLGSSHVEHMYRELRSGLAYGAQKEGGVDDDILGVGVRWHRGGAAVVGMWDGFGSQTQRAAELTDFIDAAGLGERSCAPSDGSRLLWWRGKIH